MFNVQHLTPFPLPALGISKRALASPYVVFGMKGLYGEWSSPGTPYYSDLSEKDREASSFTISSWDRSGTALPGSFLIPHPFLPQDTKS